MHKKQLPQHLLFWIPALYCLLSGNNPKSEGVRILLYYCQLVLLFLVCTPAFAQDTLRETKGKRTKLTVLNRDQSIAEIIHVINQKKDGLYQRFQRGRLSYQAHYKNDFLVGEVTQYDYSGFLVDLTTYAVDPTTQTSVKHGEFRRYQNGQLQQKGTYHYNKLQGAISEYFPSGKLAKKTTYKENQLHGPVVEYYPSGQLKLKATWSMGKNQQGKPQSRYEGAFISYYENGHIQSKGQFSEQQKEKRWEEFYPNGNPKSSQYYRANLPYGKIKSYFENGQLKSEHTVYQEKIGGSTSQRFEGDYLVYFANGQLSEKRMYRNNLLQGEWLSFHETGAKKEVQYFKDNLRENLHETFDAQGRPLMRVNYSIIETDEGKKSVKNGLESYWKDGQLLQETPMVNGEVHGEVKNYYPNGQLQQLRTFTQGLMDGPYLEYAEDGTLINQRTRQIRQRGNGLKPESVEMGWAVNKSRSGETRSKHFTTDLYEKFITIFYTQGNATYYQWDKLLAIQLYDNGNLDALQLLDSSNQTYLGFYFALDGKLRKLSYFDADLNSYRLVELNSKGEISSQYDQNTSNKTKSKLNNVLQTIAQVNPNWFTNELIAVQNSNKSGQFSLTYANGKPFLELELNQNVPNGAFVLFDPITSDTLVYKNFRQGIIIGDYFAKRTPNRPYEKGTTAWNGEHLFKQIHQLNGEIYEQRHFQASGQTGEKISYHSNGKVRLTSNDKGETTAEYDEQGRLLYRFSDLDQRSNWKVREQYFPGTTQLQNIGYYKNGAQDSTYTVFHANGKISHVLNYQLGKRNGTYQQWDENGLLQRTGNYLYDRMQGDWTDYTTTPATVDRYENGKLLPPTTAEVCGCQDTELANSDIKFVPSLNNLMEYSAFKKQIPPTILPIEEFNYSSIFYRNFQFSNGATSGFSTMDLLAFNPLSFYYVSEKTLKITLNPCRVRGYLSVLPTSANYQYQNLEGSSVTIGVKQIRVDLPHSPLKTIQNENFYGVFKARSLSWQHESQLKIDTEDHGCFPKATIRDFIQLEFAQGEIVLNATNYSARAMDFSAESTQPKRKDGLRFTAGAADFPFKGQVLQAQIHELTAANQQVEARLALPITLENQLYYYAEKEQKIHFNPEELIQAFSAAGIVLTTQLDATTHRLLLTFYVE